MNTKMAMYYVALITQLNIGDKMKEIKGKCSLGWEDVIAILIEEPHEFENYIQSQRFTLNVTYGDKPSVYPYLIVCDYNDEREAMTCTFITDDMFGGVGSIEKVEKNIEQLSLMIAQRNDITKLRKALSDIEEELRKAGTCHMDIYQRDRDHKMQEQFLKMANHAKLALDETKE